ncbi:glycosyltransferase [Acidiphilium sp.]|uniref:glycosyltransferase n=1 Tax=Acidiphilium sp. TaxID=527 RepID=UPI002588C5F6|nr:glycosyltransferase [Acidiphilium sp.]
MRVAQLMAGAANGGAELFFERMTLALHEAGEAVLPVIRPDPARMNLLRAAGLDPVGLRYGGPLDCLTRPRAGAALRGFGAEVAVAWMSRAAFHAPRGDWALVGRLGGYYPLKYFRRCDHLVGNTRDIVRWIGEQGWPRERIAYLPNFVADFAAAAPAAREGLGVPAAAPLVLALGRLHEVKGFDDLIRAIEPVAGAHLVIAGEGPERAALEALVAARGLGGRVHLAGWRRDVGALLRTADLFVSSSRHEPLGNMVLEAFSAATPVVAVAAEGPREIIRDGVDGALVPLGDTQSLSAAIAALLADPARRADLAAAGRARFEAEFAAPVVMATWRDYLAGVRR